MELDIYDHNENKIYSIKADCCQTGLCCRKCPCEACQTVEFEVFDDEGDSIAKL